MTNKPLAPGSVIGILGGGQLGRMLAVAGAELGFDVHIYDPEPDCPASRVAARSWAAPWSDKGAVEGFADRCDAITFEFENVPIEAVAIASRVSNLRPGARSLELTQDRVVEKNFINEAGVPTVPYASVESLGELYEAVSIVGLPAVLKTRRFGYDGKGQSWIRTPDDVEKAWLAIGEQSAILEAAAAYIRELSIVIARGLDGSFAAYPLAQNTHDDGILKVSRAPIPNVDKVLQKKAVDIAQALGDGMDHVGIFAVELFEVEGGQLLVNEIAPRVHNTGHWTMDACHCGQFEQHMRAVAGWKLGNPVPHSSAVMNNLIGHDVDDWENLAADPKVRLHMYGKRAVRDGRKLGHINTLGKL